LLPLASLSNGQAIYDVYFSTQSLPANAAIPVSAQPLLAPASTGTSAHHRSIQAAVKRGRGRGKALGPSSSSASSTSSTSYIPPSVAPSLSASFSTTIGPVSRSLRASYIDAQSAASGVNRTNNELLFYLSHQADIPLPAAHAPTSALTSSLSSAPFAMSYDSSSSHPSGSFTFTVGGSGAATHTDEASANRSQRPISRKPPASFTGYNEESSSATLLPHKWVKEARDRFKTAILLYGFGRWPEIVKHMNDALHAAQQQQLAAGAAVHHREPVSVEEVEDYAVQLIFQLQQQFGLVFLFFFAFRLLICLFVCLFVCFVLLFACFFSI